MQINIKLSPNGKMPVKAHSNDAGWDVFAAEEVKFYKNELKAVNLGISIAIPDGYYASLQGRSSMSFKNHFIGICGVIDSQYRGEVKAAFYYTGECPFTIKVGDKIAQLLILPVPQVEMVEVTELEATVRGEGGFGSTGK